MTLKIPGKLLYFEVKCVIWEESVDKYKLHSSISILRGNYV